MKSLIFVPKFFRANKSWGQTLVKNTLWASLSDGVVRILKVTTVVIMVRYLGPKGYGAFAFAFAYVTLLANIFDSGLLVLATREFSVKRENEELFSDIMTLKGIVGILGTLIGVLGMFLVSNDTTIMAMIFVLLIYIFSIELCNLFFAIFRGRQRMEYETVGRAIQAILQILGVVAVLLVVPSGLGVSFAYVGSGLLSLGLMWAIFRMRGWQIGFRLRWNVLKKLLRLAIPLGLAGVMYSIYMNIDSVILGYMGKIIEVGWYNAAVKTTYGVVLVPITWAGVAILPSFSSMLTDTKDTFKKRWNSWTGGMIIIGGYLTMLVLVSADQLVNSFFGASFGPSILAMRIIALAAMIMYLYLPYFHALIIFQKQKQLFWGMSAGAVVNVVMNVILIPHYGLYGAAWATIGTHLVIMAALFFFAAKYTPLKPINGVFGTALFSTAISALPAGLAMIATRSSIWISIPLGIGVFVGCVLVSNKVCGALWPESTLIPKNWLRSIHR